jgi:dTDP-4-dehydrorhamnose reductase
MSRGPARLRRALITGANGQLGLELQATAPADWTVIAADSAALDVTDADAVRHLIERERPAVVLHTAGYTAVDAAESNPARAQTVNTDGTAHVAEAARASGARMVHVSTDFVFDGGQGRPYAPEDVPRPLGVYGRTKLAAEQAVARILGASGLIVRTAWVYSRHRHNFVRTMLQAFEQRNEVHVVCDQIGTPTWARSLAQALWTAAGRRDLGGVLHWTDAGVASWYDFAVAIQEEALAAGVTTRTVPIRPIGTAEYVTAARRPSFSVLDKRTTWETLGLRPPHWRVNLRLMLQGLARG